MKKEIFRKQERVFVGDIIIYNYYESLDNYISYGKNIWKI